jgi:hypothetical protein
MVKLLSAVSVVLALAVSLASCSKKNPTPPSFDFSWSGIPVVGQPITFEPTIRNAAFYRWNFGGGDRDTSTLRSPQHIFTKPGNYNVSLKVNGFNNFPVNKYIQIHRDPQYTIYAGGRRNWGHSVHVLQANGFDSTYVHADTNFALAYINVITLQLGDATVTYDDATYDDAFPLPEVLHYTSRSVGAITSVVDVYYNHRRDSIWASVAHGNGTTVTQYFHTR